MICRANLPLTSFNISLLTLKCGNKPITKYNKILLYGYINPLEILLDNQLDLGRIYDDQ